jgi:hypothetical protein
LSYAVLLAAATWTSAFGGRQGPGVAITVYNDDFAVVRESRRMQFEDGLNKVRFTDVASAIDPASVSFSCLSNPGAVSILEQNYEYDLVSASSLLKRYIDGRVGIIVKGSGSDEGRRLDGKLMAALGGELILETDAGGIEILDRSAVEAISLKDLPEDLVTRPTLVWLAESTTEGKLLCRLTYTTGRIRWSADYSAILDSAEAAIDLAGWVTIDNRSGKTYKDAAIKLIAGDVRRIVEARPMMREIALAGDAAPRQIESKPFMEYHLYTLGRPSTVNNNQVKQIEFIPVVAGVPVEKLYIYERGRGREGIQVKLEFENTAANGLGMALPRGKVRVFKKDPSDENLEFVGEDRIDHTPKNEKLSLYVGDAFDIVAEHTLVDSRHGRRVRTSSHKIELRNRKDLPVTVFVDEQFAPEVNWRIDRSTHDYVKHDARTARFEVAVKADSEVALEYAATETW